MMVEIYQSEFDKFVVEIFLNTNEKKNKKWIILWFFTLTDYRIDDLMTL
jgi:hypothetical protein